MKAPAVRSSLAVVTLLTLGACGGGFAQMASAPPSMVMKSSNGKVLAGAPPPMARPNTEAYEPIEENGFIRVADAPLSTFSIDVDTASYSNIRRFLNDGQMPVNDAVRIEEMVNYFPYQYAPPQDDKPFAVHVEVNEAPWMRSHRLVRVGLKAREIAMDQRKPTNLVFLLDVSGSMDAPNKLPLLKQSLKLLVDQLGENDRVAIAVYAGSSGLVLPSTPASSKSAILDALSNLQPGGSTAGAAGIQLAYQVAADNFVAGGNNRVILATDGDFNVGPSSRGELLDLIEQKAKGGTFLTVLGLGMGNYKDSTLELLADKGNGNYGYIDSIAEARKILVEQMGGTLVTVAKDVKIQIEFNPTHVAGYRLIGYENRLLAAQDFSDDTKDAGEIGAGHTVTALYQVVPVGQPVPGAKVDDLKYQKPREATDAAQSDELLTVKLRYKAPDASQSELMSIPVEDAGAKLETASADFRFAAAVASFGMLLRSSKQAGDSSYDQVLQLAREALSYDPGSYRKQMLELVAKAQTLSAR